MRRLLLVERIASSKRNALRRADEAYLRGDSAVGARYEEAARYYADQQVVADRAVESAKDSLSNLGKPATDERMSAFISYSRRDYYFAEELYARFAELAELRPWMDVRSLRPGNDWPEAIEAAVDSVDVVILVASPDALESDRVLQGMGQSARSRNSCYSSICCSLQSSRAAFNLPMLRLAPKFCRFSRQAVRRHLQ